MDRVISQAPNGAPAVVCRSGSTFTGRGMAGQTFATPVLTRWGTSANADLVYRALIMHGRQSGADLAQSLDLTTDSILTALDELQGLGIAEVVGDADRADVRLWVGHSPRLVVAALRKQQAIVAKARLRLHEQLNALEFVKTTAIELRAALPITTASAVRRRLADLLAVLRHEHLAMDPDWTATVGAALPEGLTAQSLLIPGVTRLILGVSGAAERRVKLPADAGVVGLRYRELPSLPLKLIIIDRKAALVPMEPAAGFRGGAWEISSVSIARQLVRFFVHQWHKAGTADPRWMPRVQLTDRERAIIALLATEDTDAAIAVRLGLSLRTIAYTVKELMERYGVRSRFQLGLVLGRAPAGRTAEPARGSYPGLDEGQS